MLAALLAETTTATESAHSITPAGAWVVGLAAVLVLIAILRSVLNAPQANPPPAIQPPAIQAPPIFQPLNGDENAWEPAPRGSPTGGAAPIDADVRINRVIVVAPKTDPGTRRLQN